MWQATAAAAFKTESYIYVCVTLCMCVGVCVQYTCTVIQLHKAATLTLQTHVILATLQCVLILIKSCKSSKACTQQQRQQQKQQQQNQ